MRSNNFIQNTKYRSIKLYTLYVLELRYQALADLNPTPSNVYNIVTRVRCPTLRVPFYFHFFFRFFEAENVYGRDDFQCSWVLSNNSHILWHKSSNACYIRAVNAVKLYDEKNLYISDRNSPFFLFELIFFVVFPESV